MIRPLFAMWMPGPMELVIIAVIVLLLFGNRLPSMMRSVGASIVEFKKGVKDGEVSPDEKIEDSKSKQG